MSFQEDANEGRVRRAAQGDAAALERLLLNHHDRLLRRIDRGLPMDIERSYSAEDVLQEVFADVFRHIDQLNIQTPAGFTKWLDAIARNRLVNLIKEERALKRGGGAGFIDGTAADAVLAFLSRDTASPRQKMLTAEQMSLMRTAFEQLPEDYRTVLRLRFVEGLEYEQIGREMDRQSGAVRMLAMRALKHLRTLLPDSFDA